MPGLRRANLSSWITRMESQFHTFWIKPGYTIDGRRIFTLYCRGDRYKIEFVYDKYTEARLALKAFVNLKRPTIMFSPGDVVEDYELKLTRVK